MGTGRDKLCFVKDVGKGRAARVNQFIRLIAGYILKCSDPGLHFPGTFYLSLPLTHIPAETFEAKQ